MYMVLDIETASDLSDENYTSWKSSALVDKRLVDPIKIEKAKNESTDKFALSPLSGKVILAMVLTDNPDALGDTVKILGKDCSITTFNDNSEPKLLCDLFDHIEAAFDNGQVLVTYNGRTFDLPFLMKRAVIQEVSRPTHLPYKELIAKYNSYNHIDLFQVLNDYGQYSSLSEWAYRIGASNDLTSDGAKVATWYKMGEMSKIVDHCKEDVIKTYLLLQAVKGWIL